MGHSSAFGGYLKEVPFLEGSLHSLIPKEMKLFTILSLSLIVSCHSAPAPAGGKKERRILCKSKKNQPSSSSDSDDSDTPDILYERISGVEKGSRDQSPPPASPTDPFPPCCINCPRDMQFVGEMSCECEEDAPCRQPIPEEPPSRARSDKKNSSKKNKVSRKRGKGDDVKKDSSGNKRRRGGGAGGTMSVKSRVRS